MKGSLYNPGMEICFIVFQNRKECVNVLDLTDDYHFSLTTFTIIIFKKLSNLLHHHDYGLSLA